MITARNLRKAYGELVAVDDVSFELRAGETFGLLGPNGAGKTTIINMMVGLLAPDSGSVHINGETDPTKPQLRKMIGNAPQSIAIYDDLTAEENLKFFGRLYGLSGAMLKERVAHALEVAQLTDRKGDRSKTFSGGMQRRLNLACALVHDPPVLLLDEPTVGVDPQSRNLIFDKIEALRAEGRTIVYTTHYMEEAQRLCDRVAIIDYGKILDIDTVDNLITRHGGQSMIFAELTQLPVDPSVLPGELDGLSLRIDTESPLEEVARLSGTGLKFSSLRIDRPDLESVFLNLTGRRLRD
jgi:ABC-2 type transport system ATP-binding protein